MPLEDARYRIKTFPSGKRVRLAFVDNEVVEATAMKRKRISSKRI
jgi:hypothetical protein